MVDIHRRESQDFHKIISLKEILPNTPPTQ